MVFITFKSSTIDIVQNNKSNKSVDIKKEDKLAAGIIKKLKDQIIKLELTSFCKAMSNNLPALDLMISLLLEEKNVDRELINIYYSYVNKIPYNLTNLNFLIKKYKSIKKIG